MTQRYANKVDAAKYAGISRWTLDQWLANGHIQGRKLDGAKGKGHWVIDLRSIDDFIGGKP